MLSQAIPWIGSPRRLGIWAARVGEPAWDGFAALRLGGEGGGLDRFVSCFTNRLDAKGRVSIPASSGRFWHATDSKGSSRILPGSQGGRLRRQRVVAGDRSAFGASCALFGGTRHSRRLCSGQRDFESGCGGPGRLDRNDQGPCRHHAGSHLRRKGRQVSDLGTEPFSRAFRGGQKSSAHLRKQLGSRSTAQGRDHMEHGNEFGPRRLQHSPLADWPATFPCFVRRSSSPRRLQAGGIYLDATFGAGGYPPPSSQPLTRKSLRSIAIPRAIAAGPRSCRRTRAAG